MTTTPPPVPSDNVVAYLAACTCADRLNGQHDAACAVGRAVEPDPAQLDTLTDWLEIRRDGVAQADGGPGITWYCSCGCQIAPKRPGDPPGKSRRTCIHLQAIFQGPNRAKRWAARVTEDPAEARGGVFFVRLTPLGDLLRVKWGLDALKALATNAADEETAG